MPECIKDKKSFYTGKEPSPKGFGYCAHCEKVGVKRIGKDGFSWIVTKTKKGAKRWVKEVIKGKKYYTHDNGSRPYMVVINGKNVDVYNNLNNESEKMKLLNSFKANKIHIGKDSKLKGKKWDGNSILLELPGGNMVFIGDTIYKFKMAKGDTIIKYFSKVGNNDVPYPVLLGDKYFYSMVDKTYGSKKYFPDSYKINDFEDGHTHYYGELTNKGWVSPVKDIKKLNGLKIIVKR